MIPFTPDEQLSHPLQQLYLIEASAGTGKTYTIANLYLRHVLAGYRVNQVLVVTFTNAATDELRGRIRAKLYSVLQCLENNQSQQDEFSQKLLQQYPIEDAKVHLELAVHSMDEAAIFTIHGFCQRSLKEFAFLSGQSFNVEFSPDEDALLLPIAKDWWRRSLYEADALRYQVAKAAWKNDIETFYQQIKRLLSREVEIIPPLDKNSQNIDIVALFAQLAEVYFSSYQDVETLLTESKVIKRNAQYQSARLTKNFTAINDWLEQAETLAPPKQLQVLSQTYLASQAKKGITAEQLPQHSLFTLIQQYCDSYPKIYQYTLMQLIDEALQFFKQQGQDIKTETQVSSFNDLLTQLYSALTLSSGDALGKVLRERYPIAMIDEFQDTDPIQYGIFKQLYVGHPQQTLYMIGDPKQAIYSFRGGDIYTYLQAKQDVIQHNGTLYTLENNWRSTPEMVQAVNHFFQSAREPFLYKDITFQAVSIPPQKTEHKVLHIKGKPVTPLTIWLSEDADHVNKDKPKPLSKTQARQQIDTKITQYIADLLQAAKNGQVLLGDQPLRPSDIAILVPKNSDAERLRTLLSRLGVNSTSSSKQTVFESPEAEALQQLLQAIHSPNNRQYLRQALASSLFAYRYDEIYQRCQDEQAWFDWIEHFYVLHQQWQNDGFMPMFLNLLEQLDCVSALAKQYETDRRMTNLLQLGELLQTASTQYTGMDALLTWFQHKLQDGAGYDNTEAELRLESDDESVKLVTLHASKGLEYGVVFLPYLWDLRITEKQHPIFFHNETQQLQADMGSLYYDQHLRLADYERIAEQCRIIYVALTRSIACCHIVWGNIGTTRSGCADNSALGYLLHGKQTVEALKTQPLSSLQKMTCFREEIQQDLHTLVEQSEQSIQVTALSDMHHSLASLIKIPSQQTTKQVTPPQLSTQAFNRSLANDWRIASFSSLSHHIYPYRTYSESSTQDAILNFPAGKRTGLYLHRVLELLDFQGDIAAQMEQLNQRLLPRYGLDVDSYNQTSQQWLQQITSTSLNAFPHATETICAAISLAELPAKKRLNEISFHFSTGDSTVNIQQLNQLLAEYSPYPLQILTQQDFQGLVNGVIDLIFEDQGRYYIVDYKSNYLGDDLSHYQYDKMQADIASHRYDLQYMLYSLALQRFLQTRLLDYDYTQHFGGVYYLYLRGMRNENEHQTGIYFTRPDAQFLAEFDHLFSH